MNNEINIIHTALYNKDCLDVLAEKPVDFFTDKNCKLLHKSIIELYEDNEIIDLPTVLAKIELEKKTIDGQILDELLQATSSFNFEYLIRAHEQIYINRKRSDYIKDMFAAAQDNNEDKFNELFQQLADIKIDSDSGIVSSRELASKSLDDIYDGSYFTKTGLNCLDDTLIGLFDGQFIVIAGRPGRGKTSLGIQLMKNIKKPILFISGEMDNKEIYSKLLSNKARVESWKIEAKKMNDNEMDSVLKAHDYFRHNLNLSFYDGKFSHNRIKSIIKKEHKKNAIIMIDYLQIIGGGQGSNEHLRIGSITRDFKNLARELKKPIIVFSQLSREVDRHNREPNLSDLRESGAIEADADVVLFLHEDKDDGFYCILSKSRKTRTGSIKNIEFVKEYSLFRDKVLDEKHLDALDYLQDT